MKITITFKDPDGVWESIEDATKNSLRDVSGDLSNDEFSTLVESRRERLMDSISTWVEYGEYVTIEIDTETGKAVVVPVRS